MRVTGGPITVGSGSHLFSEFGVPVWPRSPLSGIETAVVELTEVPTSARRT
jgi:hypothetical protein